MLNKAILALAIKEKKGVELYFSVMLSSGY